MVLEFVVGMYSVQDVMQAPTPFESAIARPAPETEVGAVPTVTTLDTHTEAREFCLPSLQRGGYAIQRGYAGLWFALPFLQVVYMSCGFCFSCSVKVWSAR